MQLFWLASIERSQTDSMAAMFNRMRGNESPAAEPAPNPTSIDCTCRRLRRMARLVTQLYDEALSAHDLTIAQFGLMTTIAEHRARQAKDISIGALANIVGLDPTTLNRNLNTLQRQKLVGVRADDDDRRVRAVALTAAGRQRLKNAVPAWRAAQADLERRLGGDAVSALNETLDRSRDRLTDSMRTSQSEPARA
jgi:DNA-binding MarR family transcriptional regulator